MQKSLWFITVIIIMCTQALAMEFNYVNSFLVRDDYQGAYKIIKNGNLDITKIFKSLVLDREHFPDALFFVFHGASLDVQSKKGKTIHQLLAKRLYKPLRCLLDCYNKRKSENGDMSRIYSCIHSGQTAMCGRIIDFLLFFSCRDGVALKPENFEENIEELKRKMDKFFADVPSLIQEYEASENKAERFASSLSGFLEKYPLTRMGRWCGNGDFFDSFKFALVMLDSREGDLLTDRKSIIESIDAYKERLSFKLECVEKQRNKLVSYS